MMRKPTIIVAEFVLCAALLAFLSFVTIKGFETWEASAIPVRYDPPTIGDVNVALYRIGITPETLAAAGGDSDDVTTVFSEMDDQLTADPGLIASVDSTLADARREADRLVRLVKSGQATQQEIADCQTALSDLATAQSDLASTLNTLFDDVAGTLTAQQETVLGDIRDNDQWDMPTEFLVVDREESTWIRLREALANERISEEEGEDPDPDDQAFLATQRSNASVSLAITNLDTNLSTITTAWNNQLQGE